MARHQKLSRRQKRDRGMEKPGGTSNYARKHALQSKGIFGPNSPFRAVKVQPKSAAGLVERMAKEQKKQPKG